MQTQIQIADINSNGIKAQAQIDGISEVTLIGTNGKTGDAKTTAYWFGGVRVIDTNGDPIWEEQDPEAFHDLMQEIDEDRQA
jgi:hypothetical protein